MKRRWIITVAFLVVCLALALNPNPTEAQDTQQTREEGEQAAKRRIELREQEEQGMPDRVEESQQQGREEKQQTTEETWEKSKEEQQTEWREGDGGKPKEERQREEVKEGKRQLTRRKEGEAKETRKTDEPQQTHIKHGGKTKEERQREEIKESERQRTQRKKGETKETRKTEEESQHRQDERGEKIQPNQTEEAQTTAAKRRYRFLVAYPLATRSHSIFYGGIISALLDAGHHVVIVAPHSPFETNEQVRTVLTEEGDVGVFVKDAFSEQPQSGLLRVSVASPEMCSNILARPDVQELMKEEFDMIFLSLSFCDCFLSFVHQLKVPYAWLSPVALPGPIADVIGSPQFPSFMGSRIMHFSHPIAFHQRLVVAFLELNFQLLYSFSAYRMEDVCRQRGLCPPDMPSLKDMARHASLVIHNCVKPLERPARPAVPQELYAGGIQCRPAKPLPEELEAWVQGAGDAGFIFFSLGSIIKGSGMPEKIRVALLEVFAGLEQRVLWKWDQDTMKDLPSNVRLAKWLPQQDILGHPRLRLFITHGGLMSTMEASCHGAPVLGLPLVTDQHTNMELTRVEGWGRYLTLDNITAETLREAVLVVMTDKDIQGKAKHRASMIRDQPMTPAAALVFWVEYVIRHRGAHHLRCPAADMPWYQLYNVDVWATVAAVVAAVTYLTIRLTLALCWCLCDRRARKSKKD